MKAKSFKKLFVSLALSTILTFSGASSAFAATALLQPVEQSAAQSADEDSELPAVDSGDAQAAGATYLTAQSGIRQSAATVSSVTLQWNPVSGAAKYAISNSNFGSSSFKLLGYVSGTRVTINKLATGKAYTVKVSALNSAGSVLSSRVVDCTTLYAGAKIKTSYETPNGYTFNMQVLNPANSITGYKVMYQSSATQKKNIRYFNTRYSFTLPTVKNTFYQVKIYPYLTLNNKLFVSPTPATRYIAKGVILQKAGNTNTTMSVKWKKVSGANSYSVYIQYPGSSSLKKVITTTSNTFTLTNMKKNTKYRINVIANKKVNGKNWTSASNPYSMSLS